MFRVTFKSTRRRNKWTSRRNEYGSEYGRNCITKKRKLEESDTDSDTSTTPSIRMNITILPGLSFQQQNEGCSRSSLLLHGQTRTAIWRAFYLRQPLALISPTLLIRPQTPVLKAYAYLVHIANDDPESSHPDIIPE
ncbi:11932_t:CDS:2 [Gigaspora margarita]|uniref:11932_t:CDS:1 n=1 Tax=Gigaspora margarita TaxID=4874 RepID=A0ABN7ULV5_GIGMA|nr:11932_t:CDS:2 [Gigaspora margarita]